MKFKVTKEEYINGIRHYFKVSQTVLNDLDYIITANEIELEGEPVSWVDKAKIIAEESKEKPKKIEEILVRDMEHKDLLPGGMRNDMTLHHKINELIRYINDL